LNKISDAFEDLSHALRILQEAHFNAHRYGLLNTDSAEAIGNIETGYASVLNAFHSIYDVMKKEPLLKGVINWYDIPELVTILILRNARHHNQSRKIRTLYTYHIQESDDMGKMSMYILVDFPAQEENADTFDVYISWGDIDRLLKLPKSETRIEKKVATEIRKYIDSEKFSEYARFYKISEEKVFINVIPLIVNAAAKLIPAIKPHVTPRSTESETFLILFSNMEPALTKDHEVNCGPIALIP
jgi:hypothetical protein